jgi:hypothetical protein
VNVTHVAHTLRNLQVSCQFAMHYFFETEASAHNFFRSVSRQLLPGGRYIATTVDSRGTCDRRKMHAPGVHRCHATRFFPSIVVVQKLLQLGPAHPKTVRIKARSGEDVCTLEFEDEIWDRLFRAHNSATDSSEEMDAFGLRYK